MASESDGITFDIADLNKALRFAKTPLINENIGELMNKSSKLPSTGKENFIYYPDCIQYGITVCINNGVPFELKDVKIDGDTIKFLSKDGKEYSSNNVLKYKELPEYNIGETVLKIGDIYTCRDKTIVIEKISDEGGSIRFYGPSTASTDTKRKLLVSKSTDYFKILVGEECSISSKYDSKKVKTKFYLKDRLGQDIRDDSIIRVNTTNPNNFEFYQIKELEVVNIDNIKLNKYYNLDDNLIQVKPIITNPKEIRKDDIIVISIFNDENKYAVKNNGKIVYDIKAEYKIGDTILYILHNSSSNSYIYTATNQEYTLFTKYSEAEAKAAPEAVRARAEAKARVEARDREQAATEARARAAEVAAQAQAKEELKASKARIESQQRAIKEQLEKAEAERRVKDARAEAERRAIAEERTKTIVAAKAEALRKSAEAHGPEAAPQVLLKTVKVQIAPEDDEIKTLLSKITDKDEKSQMVRDYIPSYSSFLNPNFPDNYKDPIYHTKINSPQYLLELLESLITQIKQSNPILYIQTDNFPKGYIMNKYYEVLQFFIGAFRNFEKRVIKSHSESLIKDPSEKYSEEFNRLYDKILERYNLYKPYYDFINDIFTKKYSEVIDEPYTTISKKFEVFLNKPKQKVEEPVPEAAPAQAPEAAQELIEDDVDKQIIEDLKKHLKYIFELRSGIIKSLTEEIKTKIILFYNNPIYTKSLDKIYVPELINLKPGFIIDYNLRNVINNDLIRNREQIKEALKNKGLTDKQIEDLSYNLRLGKGRAHTKINIRNRTRRINHK